MRWQTAASQAVRRTAGVKKETQAMGRKTRRALRQALMRALMRALRLAPRRTLTLKARRAYLPVRFSCAQQACRRMKASPSRLRLCLLRFLLGLHRLLSLRAIIAGGRFVLLCPVRIHVGVELR